MKFRRAHTDHCGTTTAANAAIINANSEAIMELNNALRRNDHRLLALEQPVGPAFTFRDVTCKIPGTMTADEAADIILAEQAKLTRALNDPKLRVWTRGVVALMVGALREHGRAKE